MSQTTHCLNCSGKREQRMVYVWHPKGTCPFEGYTTPTGSFYRNPSYDFVHPDLAPTPIRIHSKRQWRQELKKRGLTDDIGRKAVKKSIKSRPFDRVWDHSLSQAIEQSIREVRQKPFSVIGKKFTPQEMRSILRNDLMRQQRERVHA